MKNNLDQNQAFIQSEPFKKFPTWAIILISALVAGVVAASGTYYFMRRDKTAVNNEPSVANQPTESPIPTTSQDENQVSENFVYMKSLTDSPQGQADIIVSNFDGSSKLKVQTVPKYVGPLDDNDVSQNGRIVYSTFTDTEENIWISDQGALPRKILTLNKGKSIESTIISPDGEKIAYSVINWGSDNSTEQLWTMNADGTDNKMVIDNTGRYIVEKGPFRLAPVAWSKDKTKVYMITTSDSEATPKGMYVADLLTAKIQKAQTPDVTLWGVSFSPDRTKVAYTTFEWKDIPDSFPKAGPPYTVSVTDLSTGVTEKILESQSDQYSDPIWSPDSKKIMYKIARDLVDGGDPAILVFDTNTKKTNIVVPSTKNTKMRPWAWLSNDIIIYTEESYTTGQIQNKVTTYLFTVKIDGSDKQIIDLARDIIVFGSLR